MRKYEFSLAQYPNGVLATIDGNQVKTRVFQYLFMIGGRIYFCTASNKSVYMQLKANPSVSFCTWGPDYSPVLSINGTAVFDESMELKERALEENPEICSIYKNADNPILELFYIDVDEVQTFSFEEGAKTICV